MLLTEKKAANPILNRKHGHWPRFIVTLKIIIIVSITISQNNTIVNVIKTKHSGYRIIDEDTPAAF